MGVEVYEYSKIYNEWINVSLDSLDMKQLMNQTLVVKDKFFEERKAYFLGKEIEYQLNKCSMLYDGVWKDCTRPSWGSGYNYRVKKTRIVSKTKSEQAVIYKKLSLQELHKHMKMIQNLINQYDKNIKERNGR